MTIDRMQDLIYKGDEPKDENEQIFVYWFNKRELGYTYMEIVSGLEELTVWDDLDVGKLQAAINATILQDLNQRSVELNIIKSDTEVH